MQFLAIFWIITENIFILFSVNDRPLNSASYDVKQSDFVATFYELQAKNEKLLGYVVVYIGFLQNRSMKTKLLTSIS